MTDKVATLTGSRIAIVTDPDREHRRKTASPSRCISAADPSRDAADPDEPEPPIDGHGTCVLLAADNFTVDIAHEQLRPTPELCRIYGLIRADSYAESIVKALIIPEDAHLVSTASSRARGERIREAEYRIRRADTGDLRWIHRGEIENGQDGRPAWLSGAARDITDQRTARGARAASEARCRALFETIDDGCCILEFRDGPHGPLSD